MFNVILKSNKNIKKMSKGKGIYPVNDNFVIFKTNYTEPHSICCTILNATCFSIGSLVKRCNKLKVQHKVDFF